MTKGMTMRTKLAVSSVMGAAAALVTACGHDDNTTMTTPPPPPATMSLDTADVLAMAKMTSETSEPIPVDDGMVTLTDTSETTDPLSVDAT